MVFDLFGPATMALVLLFALGISCVVAGSKAGYPIRFLWCFTFQHRRLRWLWGVVRCPYCNSFWTGGLLGWLVGSSWFPVVQAAFTTCGVMCIVQAALGGDGVVMVEDYESVFDNIEEEDNVNQG